MIPLAPRSPAGRSTVESGANLRPKEVRDVQSLGEFCDRERRLCRDHGVAEHPQPRAPVPERFDRVPFLRRWWIAITTWSSIFLSQVSI